MITLKVPEGGECDGCMFLDIDYMHNKAKCNLFNAGLSTSMQFGSVSKVFKCDKCPVFPESDE